MKTNNLFKLILLIGLAFCLASAVEGEQCTSAADCDENEICFDGSFCARTCEDDSDCIDEVFNTCSVDFLCDPETPEEDVEDVEGEEDLLEGEEQVEEQEDDDDDMIDDKEDEEDDDDVDVESGNVLYLSVAIVVACLLSVV
ncbi:hypothetical protein PPERSA_08135 [Pseudocohnilembus persalinus]|uniref:Uncharacterized protein n=1 Tax=Pseudocohnilembus persalinus TaxID=266149 RepID=A0A0V0QLG7_PSEPJ|nr:hypothetical protein PPERSA_08135 [Pseudocohnilembus persalinus]|eukprot:KRX03060.1 hypothetical protein PPERSA_08135 [Pseudocohnilembus persalinus]